MKISFSTLACPEYSWSDIYSMAKDIGFHGIEIRGLGDDIFAVNAQPFSDNKITETIKTLQRLNLEIPCLSSGCALKNIENTEVNLNEISQYIELAKKLNTPYIRILADREPMPVGEVDDNSVCEVLKKAAALAENTNVTLLVETNGVYSDTKRLKKLIDAVDSDHVAVLWDVHHPYRYANESPEESVMNLGSLIKYVHVKDSVMIDGKAAYRLMGEGDLPIDQMMSALKESGYDGYVSLEWVKRWAKQLSDAGIVFPHFAHYMQKYLKKKDVLQSNIAHTGKFIWPKEHLIDYTFPQLLDKICENFPDQYAFRYTELDYSRTYTEFREDVDEFARALISMGVRKGDHVAIWATNVPQWYITFWATTKIGAVLVTVNTAYKIHEAEYLLRQSDTHTLVMIDGYKD